jgi:hypothetical protein
MYPGCQGIKIALTTCCSHSQADSPEELTSGGFNAKRSRQCESRKGAKVRGSHSSILARRRHTPARGQG